MSDITVSDINKNLAQIQERIQRAAEKADRNPAGVQIVAVTKGHDASVVRSANEVGLDRLGENRVREGLKKMGAVDDLPGLQWDMIGHIQSRKAKLVAPAYHWVHSVDREKIARYLDRYAGEEGRILPVLLECNVSGEESKYGFDLSEEARWTDWLEQVKTILAMEHLSVRGLMTMAPWEADEDIVRSTFARLRRLRAFLREELPAGSWEHLSMGMTDDYEIAVEEGATILRLGRALFGPRP
ncbi:MAG: YggS family pyridoxal phosphate-dependent enzyme [Anaerolineales bacterium]